MRRLWVSAALIGALALSACATSSTEVSSTFSSPLQYQGYSCEQLAFEDRTLASKASVLRDQIDRRAQNDKIAVAVGVLAFWPALFFVKGDGAQVSEYGELKGQHEALQQSAAMQGCVVGASGAVYDRAADVANPVLHPTAATTAAFSVRSQALDPTAPENRVTVLKVVQ